VRYALSPYIKQIRFVFKGLIRLYLRWTQKTSRLNSGCSRLKSSNVMSARIRAAPRCLRAPTLGSCAFETMESEDPLVQELHRNSTLKHI
jgi:hypothetical protein